MTYGGNLDLDHTCILLVEFLNKSEESILVGLTDNAPHIELNTFKVIGYEVAFLISGKVVNDAVCVCISLIGLVVVAAGSKTEKKRKDHHKADDLCYAFTK